MLFRLLVTLVLTFLFLAFTNFEKPTQPLPVPASSNCKTFQSTDLFGVPSSVSLSFTLYCVIVSILFLFYISDFFGDN